MANPTRETKTDVYAPPVVKRVPIQDRPRDAEFAWLREHAPEYRGQWVALDGATLLGAAFRLQELFSLIGPAGRQRDPLFHRVDVD